MAALQNTTLELEARIAAVQQIAMFAIQLLDDQHVAAGNASPVDMYLNFFETFDPAASGARGDLLMIEKRQKEIVQLQLKKAQEMRQLRQSQTAT